MSSSRHWWFGHCKPTQKNGIFFTAIFFHFHALFSSLPFFMEYEEEDPQHQLWGLFTSDTSFDACRFPLLPLSSINPNLPFLAVSNALKFPLPISEGAKPGNIFPFPHFLFFLFFFFFSFFPVPWILFLSSKNPYQNVHRQL